MSELPLFVYGTLMRGELRGEVLARAPFLGAARTEPRYGLRDLGPFPAMVEGGETAVRGELYEVDAALLAALDEYEGCPFLYVRAEVLLEGGGAAQAYLRPPGKTTRGRAIASGDWRRR